MCVVGAGTGSGPGTLETLIGLPRSFVRYVRVRHADKDTHHIQVPSQHCKPNEASSRVQSDRLTEATQLRPVDPCPTSMRAAGQSLSCRLILEGVVQVRNMQNLWSGKRAM